MEVPQIDFQTLLAHVHEGVYFTDVDRRVTYWNEAAERITGYSAAEVVGHHCRDNILIHVDGNGHSLCKGRCPLTQAIANRQASESRVFLHHKQGHRVPVSVRVVPLMNIHGHLIGGAEFFSETVDLEALENRVNELEQLALIDPLTQLPNRAHLQSTLTSLSNELERLGTKFGILFLDIDHFKNFNDTYGHGLGDKVLKTVANTLKASRRPYDMIGRWGGEEFVGLIRSVDEHQMATISERQRLLVSSSIVPWQDQGLTVTVSVGATLAKVGEPMDTVIKRADQLMYQSKHNGRNRVTFG